MMAIFVLTSYYSRMLKRMVACCGESSSIM